MNPISTIFNAVRGNPAALGGAGGNPYTGQPMQRASEGAAELTPAQSAEMTVTVEEPAPDPNCPTTMPHWQGAFLQLDKMMQFVSRRHGAIFTDEELKKLSVLQEHYERLTDLIMRISVTAVKTEFLKQREQLTGMAAEGDEAAVEKILKMDVFQRDELAIEMQEKRSMVKRQRNAKCQEALIIVIPASERFAATCGTVVAEQEEIERSHAFEFGVVFRPSLVLQGLSQLRWVPLKNMREGHWQSPQHQVAGFGVELDSPALKALKKGRADAVKAAEKAKAETEKEQAKAGQHIRTKGEQNRQQRLEEWKCFCVEKAKSDVATMGDRAGEETRQVAEGNFSSPGMKRAIENFK